MPIRADEKAPLKSEAASKPSKSFNPLLILGAVILTGGVAYGVYVLARKLGEPSGCEGPADNWAGRCRETAYSAVDVETSLNTTLVLGGMASLTDTLAALGIAGLTNLVLMNNEAAVICEGSDQAGAACGMTCDMLLAQEDLVRAAKSNGVDMTCFDRPNLGRGEGGLFQYVAEHYDRLGGVYVFSQSTIANEEGRLAYIEQMVSESVTTRNPPPVCHTRGVADMTDLSSMCPGDFMQYADGWSLFATRTPECTQCWSAPDSYGEEATFCNTTFAGRLWGSVCQSSPQTMATWLGAHAPGPTDSVSPCCYLGFARTTASALRRRPQKHYATILNELNRCASPEASHYIERAMLYLFASV